MFNKHKDNPITDSLDENLPDNNEGLPTSSSPSGLCPRCNRLSSFDNLGSLPATIDYDSFATNQDGKKEYGIIDRASSLLCRNCKQPVIVIEEEYLDKAKDRMGGHYIKYKGNFWWPLSNINSVKSIPDFIKEIYREAIITFHSSCFRASAAMSRATIESICTDKGEVKGRLVNRIDNLIEKGILLKTLGELAHEIRDMGNDGVHDFKEEVSKPDAKQILDFLDDLIKYLYILPEELRRKREKK